MTTEQTESLIMDRLDKLVEGQSQMNGELKAVISKIDEQDRRHCDQISDIKKDIEKGIEGRKVLHQKTDEIEKKVSEIAPLREKIKNMSDLQKEQSENIKQMKPTVDKGNSLFKHSNKIFWGLVSLAAIKIVFEYLPKIIEMLNKQEVLK